MQDLSGAGPGHHLAEVAMKIDIADYAVVIHRFVLPETVAGEFVMEEAMAGDFKVELRSFDPGEGAGTSASARR